MLFTCTFLQIDCTTEGKKCTEHNIHAFPSLKLFKDGREVCSGVLHVQLYVNKNVHVLVNITKGEGSPISTQNVCMFVCILMST